jgi:hypothetical protein
MPDRTHDGAVPRHSLMMIALCMLSALVWAELQQAGMQRMQEVAVLESDGDAFWLVGNRMSSRCLCTRTRGPRRAHVARKLDGKAYSRANIYFKV